MSDVLSSDVSKNLMCRGNILVPRCKFVPLVSRSGRSMVKIVMITVACRLFIGFAAVLMTTAEPVDYVEPATFTPPCIQPVIAYLLTN